MSVTRSRIRIRRHLAVALLLLASVGRPAWAQSPEVADGFERGTLDLKIWNPIQLRAERYRIDSRFVRSGEGALAISVAPSDRDCEGTCQRNEIRIANNLRLAFGQGAWYGFSFRLRGAGTPQPLVRWVIGQWKEETGKSPFLAQRYTGGVFHITVQDNDCRVLVARAGSTAEVFLKTIEARAYDAFPFVTNVRDYDCTAAVSVEYGDPILPDPDRAWVNMVYYVKGGRDGSGRIEVWANGRFVARVHGRIGNDEVFGPTQYFKIGIYRDPMAGNATLYFDNFRRGHSRAAVDPARGVTR